MSVRNSLVVSSPVNDERVWGTRDVHRLGLFLNLGLRSRVRNSDRHHDSVVKVGRALGPSVSLWKLPVGDDWKMSGTQRCGTVLIINLMETADRSNKESVDTTRITNNECGLAHDLAGRKQKLVAISDSKGMKEDANC